MKASASRIGPTISTTVSRLIPCRVSSMVVSARFAGATHGYRAQFLACPATKGATRCPRARTILFLHHGRMVVGSGALESIMPPHSLATPLDFFRLVFINMRQVIAGVALGMQEFVELGVDR